MNGQEAFLKAIADAHYRDDSIRLIYCDWLGENGHEEESAALRHEIHNRGKLPKFQAAYQLAGRTMVKVECNGDTMDFIDVVGRRFALHHNQDCCESVSIYKKTGNLEDLFGTPILRVDESTVDAPTDLPSDRYVDSETWTLYRFVTAKGTVEVLWLGESNGYYSESVDFMECD